jgi:serine phosphatase RsbU (regulator of sigma subunit)
LGVSNHPVFREVEQSVGPGSTLVLYTDGLVERRNEVIDDGLARLAGVLSGLAGEPDAVCDQLITVLLDGREPADDVAVVTISIVD